MNNWFKRNILDVFRYNDGECYAISLFGQFVDFRRWFVFEDYKKGDPWLLEYEVMDILEYEEKRNKKRKNKISPSVFKELPWYKTIIKWNYLFGSRSFILFLVGVLFGFLVGVFV